MSVATIDLQPAWALPSWDEELARLHRMYAPPAWARGAITRSDAEFLTQAIAVLQPQTVVEIGVASGVSSAVILHALDRLPAVEGGRLLQSCDIVPSCYFNAEYNTGAAVREMNPHAKSHWLLDTDIDARRLSQEWQPNTVDLTLIDANHYHPWPLLDLLHMTYVAKPRSWVVLHDIDLPRRTKLQVHGAMWLFEAWPFAKIQGEGAASNIGAVQLPDQASDLLPMTRALLERPWEHMPTMWHVDLPGMLAEAEEIVRAHIERPTLPAEVSLTTA
jgi:predicted O-methyltransferase YrrM